ncbi:MAG TPA: glycosyltransferase family 9 protein [Candidatus Binatia bacterium]|nr:glycosyltransferase family 9 protein [Candidatus Binatia bacterium]
MTTNPGEAGALASRRWRLGNAIGRFGREVVTRVLERWLPAPEAATPELLAGAQRILLVRTNFRLGNTVMTLPLVAAFRAHSPVAQIDFLACDKTMSLAVRLPVDRIHSLSRRFLLFPWRFFALAAALRREHYDVAVDCGFGSVSAAFLMALSGAKHRIGGTGRADRLLTAAVPRAEADHVYDRVVAHGCALGLTCSELPELRVCELDRAAAARRLDALGLMHGESPVPFVGVFFGGHRDKRGSWEDTVQIVRDLAQNRLRVLVVLGPDEADVMAEVERDLPDGVSLLRPQPLPVLAAIWSLARLVVAPDSGPMHLAVAVGAPTIALLRSPRSWRFRPRGPRDLALVRPSPTEAAAAILRAWFAPEAPAVPGHRVSLAS